MDLKKTKTTYCEMKEAQCLLEETSLDIAYMVLGDGNGTIPEISKDMTQLINQKLQLNVSVDKSDLPRYKFIADVPADTEEFKIREVGLVDSNNKLLYVTQMEGMSTNLLTSGISKQLRFQIIFTPLNGINVVVVDPTITTASVDYLENNFPKLDENGKISKDVIPQTNQNTKYTVNHGAVDENGNPAYLVCYTAEVEAEDTESSSPSSSSDTTDSTTDSTTTAEGETSETETEPTTETHTYLKLLANTVYSDKDNTYTVASDVVLDITDKNVEDKNYNIFVERVNGANVLTVKENLVEVAHVGTTPTVPTVSEDETTENETTTTETVTTVDDNYLIIPQEPLQAYWVNTSGTKTPTNAVNIGSYCGGGN